MRLTRRKPQPLQHPPVGTPEFARWLNGPVTRFCGHGYHQGNSQGSTCKGTVSTLGFESPCECSCHGGGLPMTETVTFETPERDVT